MVSVWDEYLSLRQALTDIGVEEAELEARELVIAQPFGIAARNEHIRCHDKPIAVKIPFIANNGGTFRSVGSVLFIFPFNIIRKRGNCGIAAVDKCNHINFRERTVHITFNIVSCYNAVNVRERKSREHNCHYKRGNSYKTEFLRELFDYYK